MDVTLSHRNGVEILPLRGDMVKTHIYIQKNTYLDNIFEYYTVNFNPCKADGLGRGLGLEKIEAQAVSRQKPSGGF